MNTKVFIAALAGYILFVHHKPKVLMRKNDELLTEQDVMGLLGISDTTHRRYVKTALQAYVSARDRYVP